MFIEHEKGQGYQCSLNIWKRTRLSLNIEKVKAINAYDHWKKDNAFNVHKTLKKEKAINDHWTLIKGQGFQCSLNIEKRTRLSVFIEYWKKDKAVNVYCTLKKDKAFNVHITLKKDKPMKCKMQISDSVFSDTWKKSSEIV